MERVAIEVIYHDGSKDVFEKREGKWYWSEHVSKATSYSEHAVQDHEIVSGSVFEALAETFYRFATHQVLR